MWLVMEYLKSGCLLDIIEGYPQVQLSEPEIAYICEQVQKNYIYL